ncbi:MAG: hypothetical protein AAB410_03700 [Patescibacteria group bacterium]
MINYHKIFSLSLGLLFLVTLQVFSNPIPVFRFLLPAFLGVLAITFFYNRWYLQALNKYNIWVILRPALLQTSGFLMYLFLTDSFFKGVFLISAVLLISVFEIMLANFSENLIINESIIIAFAFCFSFFGFQWWFPNFTYLYFFGIFASLLLLARCFYDFLPQSNNAKWLNSLVVAFLSAQIFWAANYLPFHYSATAILLLDFFYLILLLNYHYIFHTLTIKKIKFYLLLSVFSLVAVFMATPWTIIEG